MPEEKRISPAVIIIPVGLGLAAVVGIAALAMAAPPPEGYPCPYCPETFDTYEDLVTHVQSVHPGERIPIHIIWQ